MWILLLKILAGIVLALICFFGSQGFWQSVKSRRFSKTIAQNEDLMEELIKNANQAIPFSKRTENLEAIDGSWANNALLVTSVNARSIGMMRNMMLVPVIFSAAISYFLGWQYLVADGIIFVFWLMIPVFGAARRAAINDNLSMALIVFRWQQDDPVGWDDFLRNAWSLEVMSKHVERHAT